MGIGFWIWLIIVVGGFLINAMKKGAQAKQQRREADYPQTDENPNKPMSFEELLREIQASKNPPVIEQKPTGKIQQSKPYAAPKSYEVDYDEDIPDEEQDLETIPTRREDRSTELYEKAKKDAFSRASLEETMKLSDTDMNFSHFKGYQEETKKSVAIDILKDLNDPEGFKKAFIMSEILKRKF